MSSDIPRFDPIDSLRGIAALMVIMVHANSFGDVDHFPSLVGQFVSQGVRGVQLFYILSAFTLFYTFDLRKGDANSTRNFLIRRFFRIAPLYYFAIGLYLLGRYIHLLGDANQFPGGWNIASNFLFLHGFSPFWINDLVPGGWSIGVEFPFYFLLPFFFSKIKNLADAFRWQVLFLVIGLVLPVLMLQVKGVGSYDVWISFITQFFPNQLCHFGFGILLYFLIIKKEKITHQHFKSMYQITFLYFVFASLSLYYLHFDWPVLNVVLSFWFSLGFSVVIFLLFNDPKFKLNSPVLMFLGKISYGLYLTHFFGYFLLIHFELTDILPGQSGIVSFLNFLIRFVLCLGISSVMAFLLHHALEKPFLNLGKLLTMKR